MIKRKDTNEDTSPLAQLLGSSSTGFPIIQQFNTFGTANMEVTPFVL